MIKVLGIVAEYNPFHNGHLYHLNKAVQLVQPDYIIAIMSGNFTQRGEPTIIDKWDRTRMALENGIHLVLELPTLYACQTAELFATGAIKTLHQTGLVTHIAFGSEYQNIEHLNTIARIFAEEPIEYKKLLKTHLTQGLSFPAARLKAVKQYIKYTQAKDNLSSQIIDQILKGSNSILAIEYLKTLIRLKSPIQPMIIPRVGSSYNSVAIEGEYSSATAIRKSLLSWKKWDLVSHTLPHISLKILRDSINRGRGPVSINSFEQLLLGMIRQASPSEIASWMDVEEGLENRIKRYALECTSIEDFLLKAKTKRYTYTRLQRILTHGLLGIKTDDVIKFGINGGPSYIRILGFNAQATPLLNKLKKTSKLPIITKPSHYYRYNSDNINKIFEYEILATDLYVLGFPNPEQRRGGQELTQGIVRI
ncbi:MAG: nucleotidyltransferase [Clostridiales bacterium]|nr:nucleotidyltransferase [Clostridiales bacterium]